MNKILTAIDQALWISFFALAVATPLIFSTYHTELFEVPKMHFVYFGASIILFLTLIKFALIGKISIPKNPIFFAFLAFVAIQIISAFFSIDKFTSVFGYPSRLNGGLLSQLAYLIIFAGALVNLNVDKAQKLLLAIVIGAVAVSLWGIPGHFGKDPSCLVLTGRLSATCWQKEFDPTIRIFSTLGQPNWLASYLVLTLPIALAWALIFKKNRAKFFFSLFSIILFLALIFTNSRAGAAGILVALILFVLLLGLKTIKANIQFLGLTFATFLIIFLFFGTTLVSRLTEALTRSQTPDGLDRIAQQPTSQMVQKPTSGGTESGQIRLVIWQGAIEAFKHRPVLGWGPETFAYTYYLFRPLAHNQTTEWAFFYNKAHNEFLNYLATIGFIGTSGYLVLILAIFAQFPKISQDKNYKVKILAKATIGAISGYLTTIFFGFSVVATQLLMFLTTAAIIAVAQKEKLVPIKLGALIGKYQFLLSLILTISGLLWLSVPARIFFADAILARSQKLTIPATEVETKKVANLAFPGKNPFYIADLAYSQALTLADQQDQTVINNLVSQIDFLASGAQILAPNNLQILRKIANSYFLMATVDPQYEQKALQTAKKLTELAPTDPQSYLTLAKIQAGLGYEDQAAETLKTALDLKSDYIEAQELLEQLTSNN